MKNLTILCIFLSLTLFIAGPAAANGIGGGQGYYEITSNPSGGTVYFDDVYKGTTPVTVAVYTTGTPDHTIRITETGYQTWEQSYSGNPFEGETIHVNADLVYIPVTEPTTPIGGNVGYYSISSSPSGATVYFDDTYKGVTPLTVSVYTTGTPGHTIRLTLSGYDTWSRSYSGNPGAGETIYVSAYLSPVQDYGTINVESSPSYATATLDGGTSYTTPCTFYNVNSGSHTIRVSKSGYETWSSSVGVSGGKTSYVYAQLTKTTPNTGSIYAISSPQGASVYVDGQYYGSAPQIASGLVPGYHSVRFSLSGYQDWTSSVYVNEGKTTTVSGTLSTTPTSYPTPVPGTGSLSVNSNPNGANVYVNNNYMGITPLTIPSVQAGSNVVRVELPGYTPWEATVQVNEGQVTSVDAALQTSPTTAPTKSPLSIPLLTLPLAFIVLLMRRKGD